MEKKEALARIAKEITHCSTCKQGKSGKPVPGEGNPDATLMLIGEAPGPQEAKTGRPFVGRSGKFLDKLLAANHLNRADFYITSPVKYYPGRRAPTKKETQHGLIHLQKQIDTIRPKMIILLGNTAITALLGSGKATQLHGKLIHHGHHAYFPTLHPSAAMRFTKIRHMMKDDFKKLARLIKKHPSKRL